MDRAEFLSVWVRSVSPLLSSTLAVPSGTSAAAILSGMDTSTVAEFETAGFEPSLDLLRGEALVEEVLGHTMVAYFPETELPREPRARFDRLWRRRERWTPADMAPFIDPLTGPGTTRDDLYLQFCRTVNPPEGGVLLTRR